MLTSKPPAIGPSCTESRSPSPLTAPTTPPETQNNSHAQFFIDALAIIYSLDAMVYRIVKLTGLTGINLEAPAKKRTCGRWHYLSHLLPVFFNKNLANPFKSLKTLSQIISYYPIITFVQSLLIGFENKISTTMGKRLKDSQGTQGTQGLSQIQQEFLGVYQELEEYIQHAPEASKTRTGLIERAQQLYQEEVQCFKDAYNGIIGRSGMIPKHAEAVLRGDDFVYSPTENRVAVGKKLRELYSQDEIGGKKRFAEMGHGGRIFFLADCIPAAFSAGCSLFFINIDWAGRYLGEKAGDLFLNKFASSLELAEKTIMVERGILALLYVVKEVYWIIGTSCWSYARDLIYDTVYFPMVTGISIGIYEELALAYPEQLTKFQKQIQEDSIGSIQAYLKTNTAILWNLETKDIPTWWANSILKECWEQATREYEKYDQVYGIADETTRPQESVGNQQKKASIPRPPHADRMTRAIIRNTPAVKRFMEGRRAFLWVLSTIGDRMGKYKNWGRFALRFTKAGHLFLQLLLSKTLFNTSKYITRIICILGMSIKKPKAASIATFIQTSATHDTNEATATANPAIPTKTPAAIDSLCTPQNLPT